MTFGRGDGSVGPHLGIAHSGVSRVAGEITAIDTFWTMSNLGRHTYVVENPEGGGEHVKIAPGRRAAPVPFEFSRVVLPAGTELLGFDVWAPRHDYGAEDTAARGGSHTVAAFPLDHTKRYFQVLTALCEPRLLRGPQEPVPTVEQVAARLAPRWSSAGRHSVQWNIDYLAVKLRLKPDAGTRLNNKKELLVSLALRFDLVRENHLAVLDREPA